MTLCNECQTPAHFEFGHLCVAAVASSWHWRLYLVVKWSVALCNKRRTPYHSSLRVQRDREEECLENMADKLGLVVLSRLGLSELLQYTPWMEKYVLTLAKSWHGRRSRDVHDVTITGWTGESTNPLGSWMSTIDSFHYFSLQKCGIVNILHFVLGLK